MGAAFTQQLQQPKRAIGNLNKALSPQPRPDSQSLAVGAGGGPLVDVEPIASRVFVRKIKREWRLWWLGNPLVGRKPSLTFCRSGFPLFSPSIPSKPGAPVRPNPQVCPPFCSPLLQQRASAMLAVYIQYPVVKLVVKQDCLPSLRFDGQNFFVRTSI